MRARWVFLAGLVSIAAIGALMWWRPELTPRRAGARRQTPGYAGSGRCRSCHEPFYVLWSTSRHGLAMQPFTPALARMHLAGGAPQIRAGGATYTPGWNEDGGWMTERGPGGTRTYPIEHVMGGKNLYFFLTTLDRGHLQVMPLAFDVRSNTWIDTTGSMVGHEPVPGDGPVHWRDRLLTFNTSCYGCHVSQLVTNYDLKTDSYNTTWAEPGINCETCHGPSEEHIRVFEAARNGPTPKELKLLSMKRLTLEQRNETCASCHAKLQALSPDFKPGGRFFDSFDLIALENADYYPDGRDMRENYTYALWLLSPCVKAGKLDCLHCHTSSGKYRFNGDTIANNACLPCHETRVKKAAAHTHHKPASPGSRCVSCHMPMTEYARMRRSDHSMRPPAPAATLAFKSPNACNICHAEKDAAWADGHVRRWHKRNYQAPVLARAALVAAARVGDWSKLPQILAYIRRRDHDEVFAASLIRLLWPCRDEGKVPVLIEALKDPSPIVRSSAASALGHHLNRETAAALVEAARDDFKVVRLRAGSALARAPAGEFDASSRQIADTAAGEYTAALRSRPDDFGSHLNLGVFYADRGLFEQALAEYETAMRLRPDFAPSYVNASVVLSQLGENGKAEAYLRKAAGLDPRNAAAQLNLGLLLAERKRLPEAEAALRKALAADATSAVAAYNLAVILSGDRLDEALGFARKAAEIAPGEPKYAYTLAYYQARKGDRLAAIRTLEACLKNKPPYPDAVKLLEQLREPR